MIVRLPTRPSAVGQLEKEHFWLPKIAPHVTTRSIAIPSPLAKGDADASFPRTWGIYAWIDGESATTARIANMHQMAKELARFVVTMRIAPYDGTPIASDSMMRGEPLAHREVKTRESILALSDEINVAVALTAWACALAAPPWLDSLDGFMATCCRETCSHVTDAYARLWISVVRASAIQRSTPCRRGLISREKQGRPFDSQLTSMMRPGIAHAAGRFRGL